ncbi:MAG: sigma factor, partial [bacterium]
MTSPIPPEASVAPAAEDRAAARARDVSLVERVRAGDNTAFNALVQAYMRQAFQLAYRVVGQREDAEDLVQEAFLAAYQYLDS